MSACCCLRLWASWVEPRQEVLLEPLGCFCHEAGAAEEAQRGDRQTDRQLSCFYLEGTESWALSALPSLLWVGALQEGSFQIPPPPARSPSQLVQASLASGRYHQGLLPGWPVSLGRDETRGQPSYQSDGPHSSTKVPASYQLSIGQRCFMF